MLNLNLHRARDLADVTREIDINLHGPLQMIQQVPFAPENPLCCADVNGPLFVIEGW